MKTLWQGSIAFGIVNIPIRLYSAVKQHVIGFVLLHAKCKTPLHYRRWCPHCEKDVDWQDTVKGYKRPDGTYLILTQEALKQIRPTTTQEIAISEFTDSDSIDPLYINSHYYVEPAKNTDQAYALLLKAMERLHKVAIGRFVMRDKEYICALQPHGDLMLLTTLHYADEIRDSADLKPVKKAPVKAKELKLAEQLVNALSTKKFSLEKYRDTFAHDIKRLAKEKGKKAAVVKKIAKHKKKASLTESLHRSLEQVRHPEAHA